MTVGGKGHTCVYRSKTELWVCALRLLKQNLTQRIQDLVLDDHWGIVASPKRSYSAVEQSCKYHWPDNDVNTWIRFDIDPVCRSSTLTMCHCPNTDCSTEEHGNRCVIWVELNEKAVRLPLVMKLNAITEIQMCISWRQQKEATWQTNHWQVCIYPSSDWKWVLRYYKLNISNLDACINSNRGSQEWLASMVMYTRSQSTVCASDMIFAWPRHRAVFLTFSWTSADSSLRKPIKPWFF